MASYTLDYDPATGVLKGVIRDDGANIPKNPDNSEWQAFLTWNSQQTPPLDLSDRPPTARRPRLLWDIYQNVSALTTQQLDAVWTDLNAVPAGGAPKWALDEGVNRGGIVSLQWASSGGGSPASRTDAQRRMISMYAQDVPNYLVNPSFRPEINIPGDQPVPASASAR